MAIHILGITAHHRDSAAVLLRDGDIVAAACEESFSRRSGDASFPVAAIDYCLREAQLAPAALDLIIHCDPLARGGALGGVVTALRRARLQLLLRRSLPGGDRHTPPLALIARSQAVAELDLLPVDDPRWRGDAACAIGAALHGWRRHVAHLPPVPSPWLGPWFGSDGIRAWLDESGFAYRQPGDEALTTEIAALLQDGAAIGWLQGRLEFGGRSLGARSILLAPGSPALTSLFGPNGNAPLLLTGDARAARDWLSQPAQRVIRARLAADAPLHVVGAAAQPRLHALLERLAEEGSPLLLCGDLRGDGEPLAAAPVDAYRCFMRASLDALVLENLLLLQRQQPLWEEPFR